MPGLTSGRVHRPVHSAPSKVVTKATAKPGLERTGDGAESAEERVLMLQSTAGNAAVAEMIQRQTPTLTAPADAGAAADASDTPTPTPRKTVRFGSQGEDVQFLQSRLNATTAVKTHLAVDAIFGPKTLGAVKEFQSAHPPLVVDGIVGPKTWAEVEKIAPQPTGEEEERGRKIFLRGQAEYEAGRYAHAYDFFTRAGELTGRPTMLFNRAQSLRRLGGRREEAIALYEQYIASPHDGRDAEAAAYIAELRGPAATGDKTADEATARALFLKALGEYEAGRFAHAYDLFTKSQQVNDRPTMYFNRAQSLRRLGGRREEAIELYEKYIASPHDSRDAEAAAYIAELRGPGATGDDATARGLFNKGLAQYEAKRYAHAYDYFTQAQEVNGRPTMYFNRAQSLRRLGGRREEAIELYEKYIASPHNTRDSEAAFWINELRQSGGAP